MRRRTMVLAIAAYLCAGVVAGPLVGFSQAASCDVTWTGPGGSTSSPVSGAWATGSNWTGGSIPSSTQNVCLPAGSYTVTLTGSQIANSITVDSGATLGVAISGGNGAALVLSSGGNSTNNGTIDLTDADSSGSSSTPAEIVLGSGATLTNAGTIETDDPGFGERVVNGQGATSVLDNTGTITVNADLQIDPSQDGLFETGGNITIASGEKLLVDPSGSGIGGNPAKSSAEFDIDGGTITDNGTFEQGVSEAGSPASGAALKVSGGTISGGGLTAVSGTYTDIAGSGVGASFTGAGSGTYTFIGNGGASATTLAGTIGQSQTVVLSASSADGSAPVQTAGNVTNDGTLELTDTDTSGTNTNAAEFEIGSGDTLTNDGTLTTTGAYGQRIIDGKSATSALQNATGASMRIGGKLELDPTTGTFTNDGTLTVDSAQTLQADPNGNGGGSTTFNVDAGSTVTNNGTLEIGVNSSGNAASGAALNVNGGTVGGANPIIAACTTTSFSGTGSGTFTLVGATSLFGGGTISGTIGANDSVTLSGSATGTGSAAVQTSGSVVNDGTFTMTDPDTSASTSAFDELNIASGSTFTNEGTMNVNPGPDASGYRSIDGTLDNAGTLNVNVLLQLALHAGSGIDNSGTVDVAAGQGIFILGDGGTYTQSDGTTSLGGSGTTLSVASMFVGGGQITGSGAICGPGGNQSAPCGSGSTATELTNGGTISPGPSPSTITIDGDYTQASSGTLDIGITSTGNDQLAITGSGNTAALDGTLAVTTATGYTPTVGQQFQILSAPGGVSGTFATASGTGAYNIAYNATNVELKALAPVVTIGFDPSPVTFGSPSDTIAAGATASQPEKITDTGSEPLQIGSLSIGGAQAGVFSLSSDGCSGQTLQAGGSCTVTVDFAPTEAGTDTAQLTAPDNAPNSPQQVSITGYAGASGARATISPNPVEFGTVGVGVAPGETVTVQNTGTAPLSVSQVALGGADAGEFAVGIDTCSGHTIAVGSSCSIGLTLTASAPGALQASLSIADNAPGSPQSVSMSASASASGTLTGTVTNTAAGSVLPLPGATIDLCTYSASNDSDCRPTTTSGSGQYTFTGVTPGTYRMEVLPPKPSLQPGQAVVQIAAGPNTENFTLTTPQPIPPGISINGQTSGTASSYRTSPDTITVPLDPAPTGTPGVTGVTVINLHAAPAGGDGIQPSAYGELQVEYQFDARGVPRFVAMSSSPGQATSFGSWSTTLANPPTVGEDVRGMTVQAVFTPSQLALPGGAVVTVTAGGTGSSSSTSAPLDGEFDYQISHYSLFGHVAGTSGDRRGATAAAARAGKNKVDPTARTAAAAGPPPDLVSQLLNPMDNPSGHCTTSGPTYKRGGRFELGGGYTWTAKGGNPANLSGASVLQEPYSNYVWWTQSVQYGRPAGSIEWQDQQGDPVFLWTPTASQAQAAGFNPTYAPNGIAPGPDIVIAPDGQSFTTTSPTDPNSGRYVFHQDGSLTDQWTGITYETNGTIRSRGTPHPPANWGGGPPQPPPPNPPSPPPPGANLLIATPPPNNAPTGWWQWTVDLFLYKDPSGTVVTTSHIPVAGAKVVLERSSRHSGPFKAVPNGSVVMSPSNRRNPGHTTALGAFGWDVINGFYQITAQHPGCTTAGGRGSVAQTQVLTVPPPVSGLRLLLRCPHLKRTATHTTLKLKKVPVGQVVAVASVQGRNASGLVRFTTNGHLAGYVPLEPRTHTAILTISAHSMSGIRATYEGDGYNAPSTG